MSLFRIVQKNLKKNLSFYSLYLGSVAFVLMIFYFSISFGSNELIVSRLMGDNKLQAMIKVVLPLLMAFVLFYMSYSNTFFMKRRMKELSIYALLGFNKRKVILILFLENIFICLLALGIGIIVGGIVYIALIQIVIQWLGVSLDPSSIVWFNSDAVLITVSFVALALIVLLFSNYRFIRKHTLLDLVKVEGTREKPIQLKLWKAMVGFVSLVAGYILALDIKRGADSLWVTIGFAPLSMLTFILIVVGTILSVHSFLPYTLNKMKAAKHSFYRDTMIITIPQFVQRITSNSRTLIVSTLISATALGLLGAGVITFYYPVKAIERTNPAAFEFPMQDAVLTQKALDIVNQQANADHIQSKQTTILEVQSSSKNLPFEYSAKEKAGFDLISASDYQRSLVLQGDAQSMNDLTGNQAIFIKYNQNNVDERGKVYTLKLPKSTSIDIDIKYTTLENTISFANSVGTLVVPDTLYQQIQATGVPSRQIMSIYGEGLRNNSVVHAQLSPLFADNVYFQSAIGKRTTFLQANSSSLLISIFASTIFLISTGSILYFTNISNTYSKINDFRILEKLGYRKSKIKKIVNYQIFITLIIPYILGSLHSIFALECFKTLMPNLIGDSSAFWLPEIVAIGIFTVIYGVYYLITQYSSYKVIWGRKVKVATISQPPNSKGYVSAYGKRRARSYK